MSGQKRRMSQNSAIHYSLPFLRISALLPQALRLTRSFQALVARSVDAESLPAACQSAMARAELLPSTFPFGDLQAISLEMIKSPLSTNQLTARILLQRDWLFGDVDGSRMRHGSYNYLGIPEFSGPGDGSYHDPGGPNRFRDWVYRSARYRLQDFSEVMGQYTNTVMFRHRQRGGLTLTVLNPRIGEEGIAQLKQTHVFIRRVLNSLQSILFFGTGELRGVVLGFMKGYSYIDHARAHLGCKSAVSVDISKFYNSLSLNSVIRHNLFYKSLVASFEINTGRPFCAQSFVDQQSFDRFVDLFEHLNFEFIALMRVLTHNGVLPTGMSYSPVISNILLGSLDWEILKALRGTDIKYTRYADDMCFSSKTGRHDDGSFVLDMPFVKNIESLVKDRGLHLNYDKTKIMGPADQKKIVGIILDSTSDNQLSIGSAKKMALFKEYAGREYADLNPSEKGILGWVRDINMGQYLFILSGILNVPDGVTSENG